MYSKITAAREVDEARDRLRKSLGTLELVPLIIANPFKSKSVALILGFILGFFPTTSTPIAKGAATFLDIWLRSRA